MKKILMVMAVLALLSLSGIAGAVTINYTVDGWGPTQYPGPLTPPADSKWGPNGYPGDTLELQTYTGTLDLTPGSQVLKINTLQWTIDYTYGGSPEPWPDMFFGIDAPRDIAIGTGTGSLGQTGLLRSNWENDYLTFYNGATTTVFVQGYKIDITPLGFAETGGSDFSGGNPWAQPSINVMARFDVSEAQVPEPMSIMLGIMGLGSVAGFRRLRRK